MANIRDVASLSGVSIASISRVLNHDPNYKVRKETVDKIYAAVKALNYTPSPAYQNKAGKSKAGNIACITNHTTEQQIDSYYNKISLGLKDELLKHNFYMEYQTSQYQISDEFLSLIKNKHFKGIILMAKPEKEVFQIIQENTKNIVCLTSAIQQYDNIRYNTFEACYMAMQYLISKGHKNIAFIGNTSTHAVASRFGRFDAYLSVLRQHHLPIKQEWILNCHWEKQLCYEMTTTLLQSNDRPSAIFASSDHMAIACVSAIINMGLKVPDDISIIGISDIEEAKYLVPPLTTISVPQYEIGRIAANMLLARINGDDTPAKQVFVPIKLIERKSVKDLIK